MFSEVLLWYDYKNPSGVVYSQAPVKTKTARKSGFCLIRLFTAIDLFCMQGSWGFLKIGYSDL
jgi:hypothetical protein